MHKNVELQMMFLSLSIPLYPKINKNNSKKPTFMKFIETLIHWYLLKLHTESLQSAK